MYLFTRRHTQTLSRFYLSMTMNYYCLSIVIEISNFATFVYMFCFSDKVLETVGEADIPDSLINRLQEEK